MSRKPAAIKAKAAAPKKAAAKKKGSYEMPEPVPIGTTLTDIYKKEYKIGPSIGTGGFGEIYAACDGKVTAPKKVEDYPFAVKIVSVYKINEQYCKHLSLFRSLTRMGRFLLKCIFL